jgi:lipid-A-disaccharide synthase
MQGAALAQEMRRRRPDLAFWGIGAVRMREAGVELLYDSSDFSAIGLPSVLAKIPRMSVVLRRMRRELARRRPALFIPRDFGVFNLRLAAHAKSLGIPVFAYFPPGSWSKEPRRAVRIASVATRIATPFPWSETILREAGADATFVGHPLLDMLAPHREERARLAPGDAPLIALLPGSRDAEVRYILPRMLDAAELLSARLEGVRFGVSLAPTIGESVLRKALAGRAGSITVERDTQGLLARSTAAAVKSGSVTLEAAILGVPMVVVYAGSALAYWHYRKFYAHRVPFIAMPNILAGRQIVRELIQQDMTPRAIADELLRLVCNERDRQAMLRDLAEAVAPLGEPGAIGRTASLALDLIRAG